jgi:hypothetical protein
VIKGDHDEVSWILAHQDLMLDGHDHQVIQLKIKVFFYMKYLVIRHPFPGHCSIDQAVDECAVFCIDERVLKKFTKFLATIPLLWRTTGYHEVRLGSAHI